MDMGKAKMLMVFTMKVNSKITLKIQKERNFIQTVKNILVSINKIVNVDLGSIFLKMETTSKDNG
jgi:hypothetical protein